ncbi:MAG: hypothetical protein ACE5KV_05165, partial [Thermoplasmata archaeon]
MRSEKHRKGIEGMEKRYARINPTVASRVNRKIIERAIPVVKRATYSPPNPWKVKKRGRPPHPPKMVVCLLV